MPVQLNLYEKIVILRRRLSETQESFGARFQVKPLTVNQWEKGVSIPAPEHLAALTVLFQNILNEEDEANIEIDTYQRLVLPNQPLKMELSVSPQGPDRVRLALEVRRRVG